MAKFWAKMSSINQQVNCCHVNDELTETLLQKLIDAGIEEIKHLYVNDLDRGPYMSNSMRLDTTTNRNGSIG